MNTHTRIVYIDSSRRTNGTNTDFTKTLSMSPNEDYDMVCVLYAQIPISYYLVSSPSNTFKLTELTTTVTITIPSGNYSANSFKSVVQTLLNTFSPNHWVYKIDMNNSFTSVSDGLYYYTVTLNTGQPTFTFTTGLYEQFGFLANTAYTFSGSALKSLNVINFIPETSLFLYSDLIETKDNNNNSILQEFYGENAVSFSNIVYQCRTVEGYSKRIKNGFSNSFTISLMNQHGNLVDLNNRPFFVTLLFYKRNDTSDIVKNYIKYNLIKEQ